MGQRMSFEEWLDSTKPEYREALQRGEDRTPTEIADRINKERARRLKMQDKSWPGER